MNDYEMLLRMFEKVNEENYVNYVEKDNLIIEFVQSDEYYNTVLVFDSGGNFKEIASMCDI